MAAKNTAKRKPRTSPRPSKKAASDWRGDRFLKEWQEWVGPGLTNLPAQTKTFGLRTSIERQIWERLACSADSPCSRVRSCSSHLALVAWWTNVATDKSYKNPGLSGAPFNVPHWRQSAVENSTRSYALPRTAKLRDYTERLPEHWPNPETMRAVGQELRECVDNLVGADPGRADALRKLVSNLRVTANTPVNLLNRMATIVMEEAAELQDMFERALSVGLTVEELSALND
jgi:hypothetical protein